MSLKDTKYGWIRGGKTGYPVPIGDAEDINGGKSSRFVVNNDGGYAQAADAGETELWGFLESATILAADNDSDGKYTRNMIVDVTAVFRVPVMAGTYVATMLGETCDLLRDGTKQGADLSANSDATLVVVGGDLEGNEFVDVMLNPIAMLFATGVV